MVLDLLRSSAEWWNHCCLFEDSKVIRYMCRDLYYIYTYRVYIDIDIDMYLYIYIDIDIDIDMYINDAQTDHVHGTLP